MKTTLTLLLALIGLSAMSQVIQADAQGRPKQEYVPTKKQLDATTVTSGGAVIKKPETKGIAIAPSLQADIKQLDEAMKPYEDLVKEYNRLAGLKNHIYEVLIKADGIDMKNLIAQPVVTQDSIKLTLK